MCEISACNRGKKENMSGSLRDSEICEIVGVDSLEVDCYKIGVDWTCNGTGRKLIFGSKWKWRCKDGVRKRGVELKGVMSE